MLFDDPGRLYLPLDILPLFKMQHRLGSRVTFGSKFSQQDSLIINKFMGHRSNQWLLELEQDKLAALVLCLHDGVPALKILYKREQAAHYLFGEVDKFQLAGDAGLDRYLGYIQWYEWRLPILLVGIEQQKQTSR